MPKNGTVKWLSLGLSSLVLVVALAMAWGANRANIAENGKDIAELDKVVCDPKDGVVVTQAVMLERQTVMQKDVDEIKADTKEILKKLR